MRSIRSESGRTLTNAAANRDASGLSPIANVALDTHDGEMDEEHVDIGRPHDDGEAVPNPGAEGGAPSGEPSPGIRRLRRSTTDRMLAGVAGGMGEYIGVDPIIVRIAFVVLTLFGGIGLVLYGAGWLLMSDRDERPAVQELFGGSRRHQVVVAVAAILVGIVTVDFVSRGPFWIGGSWRAGQALGWIAIAGVVGYLVLRGARGPVSISRALRRVGLSLLGLVAVVLLGTVCAALATGVPLSGGFGSHAWRPNSAKQMVSIYRGGVGNATLDLREVTFPNRLTHITVSVGIGRLLVEIPPNVTVSLTAHSGIGNVSYGSSGESAFASGPGIPLPAGRSPVLVLDAQAGIGQVELVRGPPGAMLAAAFESGK